MQPMDPRLHVHSMLWSENIAQHTQAIAQHTQDIAAVDLWSNIIAIAISLHIPLLLR